MLLNNIRQAWRLWRDRVLRRYYPIHGAVVGFTRRGRYVTDCTDGQDPCRDSDSAAVFCHYDRNGLVHDYVEYYLKCLSDAGFRIYFVSNAPHLTNEVISRVAPLCTKVICRRNIGHDFGAFKDGISTIPDRKRLARLLITNDSVYGPLKPIELYLSTMSPERADVWGMTDSYEIKYHVQSYFVLFHRAALQHHMFERFWNQLPFVGLKGWVIHHAEVSLTQRLLETGLRIRSRFPYEEIISKFWDVLHNTRVLRREEVRAEHRTHILNLLNAVEAGVPLNPTHFFWELLIGRMDFPFIKRDLLEINPAHVAGVAHWRELIQAHSSYDVDLIARHQKLRLKGRSI